ncbi:hypothetical protein [Citrobacter freundii]|uniref:Uncharacterized protein n=1 Tax=Citrobacter freundii TaxID=546 RepID=A0A7G2IHX1_CITFR|nr:hypothetical protein [Citrobacter freundii]
MIGLPWWLMTPFKRPISHSVRELSTRQKQTIFKSNNAE